MEVAASARGPSRGIVLHVDDDDEVRRATVAVLRTAGFDAREAWSPESALSQAELLKNQLDVLIVDYQLGGSDIAESLIRTLGHGVPIVMLTGDPANVVVPWLKYSPVWLVHKPVSPLTLIAGLWPLVAFRRSISRATQP